MRGDWATLTFFPALPAPFPGVESAELSLAPYPPPIIILSDMLVDSVAPSAYRGASSVVRSFCGAIAACSNVTRWQFRLGQCKCK
jgi:hypothetical protein